MPFSSLVTLTFDLDIQTGPSEGPNTSSLWIWHKSVQWFPRYFIHKQRSHTQRQKQTLRSACGKIMNRTTVRQKVRKIAVFYSAPSQTCVFNSHTFVTIRSDVLITEGLKW